MQVPVQRITQANLAAIAPKSLDAQLNDGDDGGGDLKDQLAVSVVNKTLAHGFILARSVLRSSSNL
jgi:hypothetical protein